MMAQSQKPQFSIALLLAAALLPGAAFAATPALFAGAPQTAQPAAKPTQMPVQLPTQATAQTSSDIDTFQQIEDKWADAVLNKDQYALELVLAPSFVGIDGNGVVSDRDEQVAQLFSKSTAKQTIDFKVVSARRLADAVVVNGTYILHLKKGDDDSNMEKGVFTHIFQQSKGGWLCINAQRTIVSNPAAAAKSKAQSRN